MKKTFRYQCPHCHANKILKFSALGSELHCHECGREFDADDNEVSAGGGFFGDYKD